MEKSKRELAFAVIIFLVMAFMDITGIPASMFLNISYKGVEPFYYYLMANRLLMILAGLLLIKGLCPEFMPSYRFSGLRRDLSEYGRSLYGIIIINFLAFAIGVFNYMDRIPSHSRIIIIAIISNIFLAAAQELYLRGLLINILKSALSTSRKAGLWSVMISAAVFSLIGAIPAWRLGLPSVAAKIVWTFAMGIVLGVIYIKSSSLLLTTLLRYFLELLPAFMFVQMKDPYYPMLFLIIVPSAWVVTAVYILKKYPLVSHDGNND